mgnify:CR=1 FL=1
MARIQWRTELEKLRRDNRSGAAEIAEQALHLLIDVIGDSVPAGVISYRNWLIRISRELVAVQPSMGILFRLVNDMLWACDEAMNAEAMRQGALQFLQSYQERSQAALQALTEHAAQVLARYPVLMTYSRSSTVLNALTAMSERGWHGRVLCGEGRPMLEGQSLANELAWVGVDVTLGIDMALFGWLPEANAIVVGADSLAMAGVINKIGTAALMRAATETELPCIVLCTTQKFLPNDYLVGSNLRSGDPEEIMPISSKNITVRNVYFDVTPLELVTTVITEKGPLEGEQVREELEQLHTYPGLRGK